ncbi:MAG: hybrid sensor histidine kinase/response regulator [Anaerolineae bacterium]
MAPSGGLELLAQAFEASDQPFAIVSLAGHMLHANLAFAALIGYSQEEALRLNWRRDLTPPEWRERETGLAKRLERPGQSLSYEKEYWRKDGSRVPVELLLHRGDGPVDDPVFYALVTDISERKRAEREGQRGRVLAEALNRMYDAMGASLDLDTLLEAVAAEVAAALEADVSAIAMRERDGWMLRHAHGMPSGLVGRRYSAAESAFAEEVTERRAPVAISDPAAEALSGLGVMAALAVPVVAAGEVIGVLGVGYAHRVAEFSHQDMDFAHKLQASLGQAATNAMLHREQQRLRQHAEQAAAAAEQRAADIETVIESVPHSVVVYDVAGRIVRANRAWYALYRYTDADRALASAAVARRAPAFTWEGEPLPPEQRPAERALCGETVESFRMMVRMGGYERWLIVTAAPLRDRYGVVTGAVSTSIDVTQLHLAQERLERASAQLDATIDSIAEAVVIYGSDARILRTNAEARRLMGGTEEDYPQSLAARAAGLEFYSGDGAPYALAQLPAMRALRGEIVQSELVAIRRRGSDQVWVLNSAAPIRTPQGEMLGAVCTMVDITALREVQEQLEEAHVLAEEAAGEAQARAAQLQATLDAIADGVVIYDRDESVTGMNQVAREVLGYGVDQAKGRLVDRVGVTRPSRSDGVPLSIEAMPATRALCGETVRGELMMLQPEGRPPVYLVTNAAPIVGPSGQCLGAIATFTDITELRAAQERLAEERERLSITLRSIGDGVIATDREGRIRMMNPSSENMTGWREAEALGRPLSDVFALSSEITGAAMDDPVQRVLDSGQAAGLGSHAVLTSREGISRLVAGSAAPMTGPSGAMLGAVLVFQDVTARHNLEEERAKVNKLESLGVLAGGIAHDFNNLLTGILGNVIIAGLEVADRPAVQEVLADAEKAAMRARGLTQQLLTFARGGSPLRRATALPDLIRDAATFALRGRGTAPRFDLAPDLRAANVDAGQIGQVIQNLVINADEAMPSGGIATIRAHNVQVQAEDRLPLAPGPYVLITVEDNGVGIPREHLARVFDPYFTTKEGGSGIGLAVVYSVVAKHDGYVGVESEPGRGTAFRVYLPAANGTDSVEPEPVARATGHRARILVMDDEEVVRTVAERMLSRLGYSVTTARDGLEAVQTYGHALGEGTPFDIVILDIYVPGGMSGLDALARLKELDPDVHAVVSSGYFTDPVMSDYEHHGFVGAIEKPYQIDDLTVVLESVLGRAES